ncbi:phage holin family protein [Azoarcus sp. TTM-91]|uniref:phage holin family protein n=1 Tax=Azoarcus sp. TTM-91 TaxID=2691581 RepID=UPI002006EF99|nr:phage holin family protein [Azoarcus sp. TTM-91]
MAGERMAAGQKRTAAGESIVTLFGRARRLAGDLLLLAVLDARYSARRAIEIVCVVVVTSVLLVTAWLALVVAASGWLVGAGVSWPAVLLVAAGLNVVAALAAAAWLRRRVGELPFAATLRQLRGEAAEGETL